MYQIANIYLLLFAGSIWDSLAEAIQNPKAILQLISAALPKVSILFINYIITVWLSGVPYKMIRRFCAIQYLWYRSCTSNNALTRRMLKNPDGPFGETRVGYGTEISDVLYVLCVVMLYWVIAPIVLILATGLFWSWYFMWKYQYVFVVTRTFESGGKFWYKIYRYSMLGLMAGTITFMAYMGIKEGIQQGPLLVPLPIIIVLAWRYTERRFRNQSKNLAFGAALKQERHHSETDLASLVGSEIHHASLGTDAIDAGSDPEDSHLPACFPSINSSSSTPASVSVITRFRPNFMKQPNLLCPARVYPYPYRLYDIPLLDKYGALNEIYLDDIPEGTDPTMLFPESAIPGGYAHVSVNDPSEQDDKGSRGSGASTTFLGSSNSCNGGKRASMSAELMAPLSLSTDGEADPLLRL